MGIDKRVFANTTLSTEEIYEILCNDMDVRVDETYPEKIVGNDFSCLVYHHDPETIISDYLEKPENLHIDYRINWWGIAGYVSFMRLLLNWLKHTDADTIFAHHYEYILLSRIDGRLIRNTHPIAEIPREVMAVIDIPYEEADLGFGTAYDCVDIKSLHDAPQITAKFCRHIFDNFDVKIGDVSGKKYGGVERGILEIDTFASDPLQYLSFQPKYQSKWTRHGYKYPFLPNYSMSIHYRRGRGIPLKRNGAYNVPARDVTLKGVAGLIKTTDYSFVVEFSDPTRDVLIYHDGELTLFQDSCWTEERLRLFDGIPYKFGAPIS